VSESSQSLREELRRQFPAEAGLEVEQAVWVELIDGRTESIPITVVRGPGVDLTFFEHTPKNLPGART
jgi:hypothetical protein